MSNLDAILADARTSNVARDEKGRFSSVTPTEPAKEEPQAAAPQEPVVPTQTTEPIAPAVEVAAPAVATPAVSDAEQAYKKAMREEREKRQNAERQLREFQQKQSAPPPDPWTDLPGALQSQASQFEERLFIERCNLTEETARDKHADYEEVRDVFLEEAQANPALMAQMRNERNPAAFAYREGLRIRELKEVNGDFSAYKSKLEKSIEERVRKELSATKPIVATGNTVTTPAVPASLNSEGSPAAVDGYSGPKPLKEILSKRF